MRLQALAVMEAVRDADAAELVAEPGRSELEDGTRVSGETSRRLTCHTGLVGVLRGEGGEVQGPPRGVTSVTPAPR